MCPCPCAAAFPLLQVRKLTGLGQKKAHLIEIQVNGGANVSDKVDFATKLFEKVRASELCAAWKMWRSLGLAKGAS